MVRGSEEKMQNEKAEVGVKKEQFPGDFKVYLHGGQLDGGDVGGVHHGLGPVGRVCQQALPLLRQPSELLLPRVEACVDAVLKVRRSRDLQPFLLLPKHAGKSWITWKTKQRLCMNILFLIINE